jgi:uncharacterized membrane protein YhaH (DUF805 family)
MGPWPAFLLRLGAFWLWIAVHIRRLHDIGRSGAWAALTVIIVPLGLLICGLQRGQLAQNDYGAAPRAETP